MINYSFTYADLEYFLLILVRVLSFIYVTPFFSMRNVPRTVRAALSVLISVVLYGAITTGGYEPVVYDTVFGYAMIVLKEFCTGIILGLGVEVCTSIISLTGAVADMEVGFSMATLMDPATGEQTTITSTMYQYLIMLILILTGMYEYLIGALADSFTLIPVNGAVFHAENLLQAFASFMGEYLSIGFRICLPVFAAILMLNAVLGIMAKVSPQMNMFAVGLQLKIVVGLGIIFLTLGLLPAASELIFTQAKKMTVQFVEAMM